MITHARFEGEHVAILLVGFMGPKSHSTITSPIGIHKALAFYNYYGSRRDETKQDIYHHRFCSLHSSFANCRIYSNIIATIKKFDARTKPEITASSTNTYRYRNSSKIKMRVSNLLWLSIAVAAPGLGQAGILGSLWKSGKEENASTDNKNSVASSDRSNNSSPKTGRRFLHDMIHEERRHVLFNSRQLSGECGKL